MKIFKLQIAFYFLFFSNFLYAEKITIAAASDLKFALDEISALFIKKNPGQKIDIIYGSSGKAFTQIQQGAPFDLYFSADINYPKELFEKGFAHSPVKLYAIGRIVLWSNVLDASKITLNDLAGPAITHIAIANPQHAPYGRRAEEALRATALWDKVKAKLVYGENIAQAAQFVQSKNAEVGIIALSLAISPQFIKDGGYWPIPTDLHSPLEQGFIITKRAANNSLAKNFSTFMESKLARKIMIKYGFVLPSETTNATLGK